MNVLVYSGPGTAKSSVMHTMSTLKSILGSTYDVMQVDAKTILEEPWTDSAAMIVVPGGRDLPYVKELGEKGMGLISAYVHGGGRYLGICAGAYFACTRLEFEVGRKNYEVVGDRKLQFFRGVAKGSAFPGFVYDSEEGARAVPIHIATNLADDAAVAADRQSPPVTLNIYHNGGCFLLPTPDLPPSHTQSILATYADPVFDGTANAPAIALCRVGRGVALVTGVHIEYDGDLLARGVHDSRLDSAVIPELLKTERKRKAWLRSVFRSMGLSISGPVDVLSPEPLPPTDPHLSLLSRAIAGGPAGIFDALALAANMDSENPRVSAAGVVSQFGFPPASNQHLSFYDPEASGAMMRGVYDNSKIKLVDDSPVRVFQDLTYEFEFLESGGRPAISNSTAAAPSKDVEKAENLIRTLRLADIKQQYADARASSSLPKLTVPPSVAGPIQPPPGKKQTLSTVVYRTGYPPASTTPLFSLGEYWKAVKDVEKKYGSEAPKLKLGRILWYGEVMPSTQTLLDKNPNLANFLPDGFTAVSSNQSASRARGRNSWISPAGCLQFSFLLRHPRSAPSVVFVQYIVAIATAEAVRSFDGCEEMPVVVKWPNDVYGYEAVEVVDDNGEKVKQKVLKKLGGILVNSSYVNDTFVLVVGHGLNVANRQPSTCLNTLLEQLPPTSEPRAPFTQEKVLARFLHHFAVLYTLYLERGFEPLVERYKKYWIHQDQIVGVEGLQGKWKIVGVDSNGYLRCRKILDRHGVGQIVGDGSGAAVVLGRSVVGEDEEVLLGPDGNGFDMMKGLIVQKR
ncbi:biotin holocarboxylase synthetase [Gonapodya sp. JEL0774]|nr:biotin holocarboxylase synthetase [Gonapodya sp. JEL0774]